LANIYRYSQILKLTINSVTASPCVAGAEAFKYLRLCRRIARSGHTPPRWWGRRSKPRRALCRWGPRAVGLDSRPRPHANSPWGVGKAEDPTTETLHHRFKQNEAVGSNGARKYITSSIHQLVHRPLDSTTFKQHKNYAKAQTQGACRAIILSTELLKICHNSYKL